MSILTVYNIVISTLENSCLHTLCFINKMLDKIKFIGDISIQDADILLTTAKTSTNILEFGCGGSTQVFAQARQDLQIISVDTSTEWIDITRKNINKLSFPANVTFTTYTTTFDKMFDLIFVDGVDDLRKDFAMNTWKYLNIGGSMIFHDTRRHMDMSNALEVVLAFHNEIKCVEINKSASNGISSNLTIIQKKAHEPYINWNLVEGKPSWAYNGLSAQDSPLFEH